MTTTDTDETVTPEPELTAWQRLKQLRPTRTITTWPTTKHEPRRPSTSARNLARQRGAR
jgi:hypothetical protein